MKFSDTSGTNGCTYLTNCALAVWNLIVLFRSGDCKHLAARYRDFNLDNLLEAAVQATGRNGTQCELHITCWHRIHILTARNRCEGIEMLGRTIQ